MFCVRKTCYKIYVELTRTTFWRLLVFDSLVNTLHLIKARHMLEGMSIVTSESKSTSTQITTNGRPFVKQSTKQPQIVHTFIA